MFGRDRVKTSNGQESVAKKKLLIEISRLNFYFLLYNFYFLPNFSFFFFGLEGGP
jgi:hypothetical protein